MSIVWWDGFDTYGNSTDHGSLTVKNNLAEKYIGIGNNRAEIVKNANRWGDGHVYWAQEDGAGSSPGWVDYLDCDLQIAGGTRTAIFACSFYVLPGFIAANQNFVTFMNWNNDPVIEFYNDRGNVSVNTIVGNNAPLIEGRWYRLELYAHIDDLSGTDTGTPGRIIIRADDGNGMITYADYNYNTKGLNGSNQIYRIRFGAGRGHDIYFDDVVVIDCDDGVAPTSFIGDLKISTLKPNADGKSNAWTPVGAGSNFQCVDDTQSNELTDYVETGTDGAEDWYNIQDLGFEPDTVIGIGVTSVMQDSAAGSRGAQVGIDSGGNVGFSPTQTASGNWKSVRGFWSYEPVTNETWTKAKIDALQIGNKRIS